MRYGGPCFEKNNIVVDDFASQNAAIIVPCVALFIVRFAAQQPTPGSYTI